MPKYLLERTQLIESRPAKVFRFFENPHNLQDITPPWLSCRVKSATNETIEQGTRIRYTIRWLGLPMRWESLIARYEKGVVFADEMLEGPYESWYHTHEFKEVPGGVAMTDRVEYQLPLGWLGRIAHAVMIRRQLHEIFDLRASEIARILRD
jgi:ligand-binding SRPBCC domain-containing protein